MTTLTQNPLNSLQPSFRHLEKTHQFGLSHDYGAGAPCLSCSRCPGLDLHFWRKRCKSCGCSIDSHDIPAVQHHNCDIVVCSLFGNHQNHWHQNADILRMAVRECSEDSGSIVSESNLSSSSAKTEDSVTQQLQNLETRFQKIVFGNNPEKTQDLQDCFRRGSEASTKSDSNSKTRSIEYAWQNAPTLQVENVQTNGFQIPEWNRSAEAQENMRIFVEQTKKNHFGVAKAVQCDGNELRITSSATQTPTPASPPDMPLKTAENPCGKCGCHLKSGESGCLTQHEEKIFHKNCFQCATCQNLLTDLLYFFKNDKYFCSRHFGDANFPRCAGCDELILTKEYTFADDKPWHNEHFCCSRCDEPLGGKQYVQSDDQQLCFECHTIIFSQICITCQKKIRPDELRLSHNGVFWHNQPDCFRCENCNKIIATGKFVFKKAKMFCSFECKNAAGV